MSKWGLGRSFPDSQWLVLLSDYYETSLDELVRGVDVGDIRALNESEKQISLIYSDVERGKEAPPQAPPPRPTSGRAITASQSSPETSRKPSRS